MTADYPYSGLSFRTSSSQDVAEPLTENERAVCDRACSEDGFTEPNLTKAMGALLSHDLEAAGRFARGLVVLLQPSEARLVPTRLDCQTNVPFYGRRTGEDRYADIAFVSTDEQYLLLLEAKLGATTGKKQVGDYIRVKHESIRIRVGSGWWEMPRTATVRAALVGRKAIDSRDVKRAVRAFPGRRSRWLGATTWLELTDVLDDVQFADAAREARWHTLIKHYAGAPGLGIKRGERFSPEQLLDGTALALSRTSSPGSTLRALPWSKRTEKIVRVGRSAAMMRLAAGSSRSPHEIVIRLEATEPPARLQLTTTSRQSTATEAVPESLVHDLRQFQAFVAKQIASFVHVA